MSLVSIVIPLHDTRAFVRRAVDSALAQTHVELEVIVVDDSSTDASVEEIRDLVAAGRVRLIAQPQRGTAAARNTGWRASRGDHLLFLDSDDEIAPRLLARLLGELDPVDPRRVAYCEVSRIGLDGELLPGAERCVAGARRSLEGDLLPALAFGGFFQVHCMLLPRRLVETAGGFDERMRWCEDFHLHLRLFALGARARFVAEPLAHYRIRPGSKSSDPARMRSWTAAAIADVARRHPAAFAAALPECRVEFEWLRESVRRDGEQHVDRCASYVAALEQELRRGAASARGRLPWHERRPAPPGPHAPRSRMESTPATEIEAGPGPEEVAAVYLRMYLVATAQNAALWRAARARLERCQGRARRLERALARRAARGVD